MAHIHNYRKEGIAVREYPTTGSGVIEVGDCCYGNSGNAHSVTEITDATGTNAAARKLIVNDAAADDFIGVAMLGKLAAETPTVLIATDGVFEFFCASPGTLNVGDSVSIDASDDNTTATGLGKTVVAATATNGIGKVARKGVTGDTTILVHIRGKDMSNGPTSD
jgi:hypothetical protein